MIIGTLSPKTENIEDTFNTLKFLESAKKVNICLLKNLERFR